MAKQKDKAIGRREFIGATAAAAGVTILKPRSRSARRQTPPCAWGCSAAAAAAAA